MTYGTGPDSGILVKSRRHYGIIFPNFNVQLHCNEYGSIFEIIGICLLYHIDADMPPGTDCPYPIRMLAFFQMLGEHGAS